MNSNKVLLGVGVVVVAVLAAHFLPFTLGDMANLNFLGGLLFLEVLIFCIWKYEQRFFPLVIIAFVWAGVNAPLRVAGTIGRWPVLAAAAVAGIFVWLRKAHVRFSAFHLVAFFCTASAFASATVSPWRQMAFMKALSLFLLLLYGLGGARAATLGREDRFFKALLWGCEVVVYVTAFTYAALPGVRFWGNPNSVGAVMSVGTFPVLLWGWFISAPGPARWRRLAALFLCVYLTIFSFARAGMAAIVLVTVAFCFCLRQYKLLLKTAALALSAVAMAGLVNPSALQETAVSVEESILYKGHKDEGALGSRRAPWEKTLDNIQQHPWFGTGYGTSPTGDVAYGIGPYSSTAETSREHGSSYMLIVEWVGLFGVLPFAILLALNAYHVLRVAGWVYRTGKASDYSVPAAMVLFAGFVHAGFEDWMFAVGSYLCVYFWSVAFILTDLIPADRRASVPRLAPGMVRPQAVRVEAIAPGR